MEGIIAILAVFGMPVAIVFIVKYFKALEKGLIGPKARAAGLAAPERQQIEGLLRERQLLEARVQNLETIVCSVDLELNGRLNRLAAEQSRMGLLPAPARAAANGAAAAAPAASPVPGAAPPAAPPAAPAAVHLPIVPAAAATAALGGEIALGATLLGRYRVEKELGRGGMGAVYLARDAELGETVALKVISGAYCCDLAAAERFRREASAARKITHANVIRIHDLGSDNGIVFISMEYFAGLTLAQVLTRRGALPLDEVHDIFTQAADGLAAAHHAGVIHRDLKPQNVLVDAARHVKLIDFGLAKASFMEGMTATGLILGTPEYMAPEQIRGRPVDYRTDIYALGCVAFHMLTGAPPFRGESPIAVGFAHCTQPPPVLRQIRPDVPPPWEAAIARALAKEPAARFDSVEEMKRAFG
ncbi:MAG TPA: serine/threonine-protein kinase [Polyangia bacterium]|jgi:serine/threonine-protein kinase